MLEIGTQDVSFFLATSYFFVQQPTDQHQLIKKIQTMTVFNIEDNAGKHFSFRDFIECGETWQENSCKIDNRPLQESSWLAIEQLATVVLDPVWEKYGKIQKNFSHLWVLFTESCPLDF